MARILLVNERCGYFGGVEQNIADTVRGLKERGHACFLAYGQTTGRDVGPYKGLFDGCFVCGELQPVPDASGQACGSIIETTAPDVIYIHKSPRIQFCMETAGAIRAVRMIHDHDLCCPRRHKYFFRSERVCHHRADWRCYLDLAFLERDPSSRTGVRWAGIAPRLREMRRNRQIDALLVGSRFMRDELLQNGFRQDQIHILPPVGPFDARPPTLVPENPHILFVGQLIRGKGVDLLLQALHRVECPFTATIAGTGNAEQALKTQCDALGLSDRVRFAGWVSHDELASYYEAARVVAAPSRWPEPFGMIGLEAMRQGRPVVGFAVGGIPDWLTHEETGLLVSEQDVPGFAAALYSLLTDHRRAASYGQAGYRMAQEKYGFETYLNRLETFLGINP